MKNLKIIFIFIILLIYLFLLTGCSENKTDEELLKEKTLSELEYTEDTIHLIVEKYLSGDYLENGEIAWQNVRKDFGEISNNTSVIILDLTSMQIEDSNILGLEDRINAINSALDSELEMSLLESLKDFYKVITDYIKRIYPENDILYKEKEVKAYLLESLYYSMIDDYVTALNSIENAESLYQELMNNVNYLNENSYNVNRMYIAIQEMKLSIQNQEKENVILRYINTN